MAAGAADRAVAVLRQLSEAEGLSGSRLRATAFGSTRPLRPNTEPSGRAANRRVEFVFLRTEIELDSTPTIAGKGKTVIKGRVWVEGLNEETAVELFGLTLADSEGHGVSIRGKGAVGKVRQCEIRGHKRDGVAV